MLRGTLRPAALALALIGALSLSGCETKEAPQPAVSSSSDRIANAGRTSERFLADAKSVYRRYLTATAAAGATGDEADLAALERVESATAFDQDSKDITDFIDSGKRLKGSAKLVVFRAQRVDLSRRTVSAYACVDFSAQRILDAKGKDVTPANRPSLQTSLPQFEVRGAAIVLKENRVWAGDSIC